jgi:hypothetical protein
VEACKSLVFKIILIVFTDEDDITYKSKTLILTGVAG